MEFQNTLLSGSGRQHGDPETLANLIRQKIDYDIEQKPASQDAFKYLRSRLHKHYIFVFKTMSTVRDLIDIDEMRGMYLHDSYAPFIAINRRDHKASQLFSLAHELAHLFRAEERVDSMDFRQLEQISDAEETFCNQTAAALFLPKARITNQAVWDPRRYKNISQEKSR